MRTPTLLALALLLGAAAPAWASAGPGAPAQGADHGEFFMDAQAVLPGALGAGWRFGAQGQWHGAFLLGELGRTVAPDRLDAGLHGSTWEGEAMAGVALPVGRLLVSPGLVYRGLSHDASDTHAATLEQALGVALHAEAHLPYANFGEANVRYYPAIVGEATGHPSSGYQLEIEAGHELASNLVSGLGYRYEHWAGETLHVVFGRLSVRPERHAAEPASGG